MAFLNFLTQGQPLPSKTSTLTTSQVPQYLSDYLYNLMSGAYSAAQEEYKPYTGPRLADFTEDQLAAFDVTRDAAESYKPQLEAAEATAGAAAGLSPMEAAQPYFEQAGETLPGVIGDYMNPYMENVTNRMGDIAARQIKEKLMPELGDQFIRAGQFGSTRQQELANRGVRDISENLASQIGAQLASGYTTAGQQAQEDLRRQASIGQAAGQITGTEMQNLANLSNVQGALAQRGQSLGLQGAAALETIGQTKQKQIQQNLDLAYKDWATQKDDPMNKIRFLNEMVRGLPSGGGTSSSSTSGIGQNYSASPLAQLASAGMSAAAISNLLK